MIPDIVFNRALLMGGKGGVVERSGSCSAGVGLVAIMGTAAAPRASALG